MAASSIYEALLADHDIRTYIHIKHLSTFESFYEGLRIVKKDLGLVKKASKK